MELKNYENIKLIIFDCDGVLIDSETISCKVLTNQFIKNKIEIDIEYVKTNFIGKSYPKVKEHIYSNFNRILKENFEENYRNDLLIAFKKELEAVSGIKEVLKNINILKCVATSSSLYRATNSLKITGLFDYLENNIFSAYGMGNKGKPAPDIYLNAAMNYNIKPEDVLVIEDSLVGIEGAKRAGMKVWHFIGASHMKSWDKEHIYSFKPDFVFDSMYNFFSYLPHLSNSKYNKKR